MRKLILVLVFGLIAAACGGTATTSESSQPVATETPVSSTVAAPSSEPGDTSAAEAPPAAEEPPASEETPATPSFDGPPAPGFDLALADGSTFSLTAEQKPTYMVFWAEW
ncbi:MAG: hypothetical protein QNJ75_06000 [Acidimicrobiia bacterium]|nr:hypothetical protein [Acidimicrobiia bacterium]